MTLKFPFSISNKIILKQGDSKITFEKYLLNQISEKLEFLNMSTFSKGENKMVFVKSDFYRTTKLKDFLRNLSVEVETNNAFVKITLKSQTIFIFIFGLIPLLLLFTPNQNFPIKVPIILSFAIWSVAYLIRILAVNKVKDIIEEYLTDLNSFSNRHDNTTSIELSPFIESLKTENKIPLDLDCKKEYSDNLLNKHK
jgi:hypothetical protein